MSAIHTAFQIRRRRAGWAGLLAAFVALTAPAAASATDRWVDAQTGSNAGANNCKVQANPCATIMAASNSSQSEGNFGTIHVDQGTYAEGVIVAQGNVLRAHDFVPDDSGPTTIAAPSSVAAFPQANATITGFTITSPTGGAVVLVANNAKFTGNTVVASGANSTAVDARDGAPTIEGNTLIAESGDEDIGIEVQGSATGARILDNDIGESGDGFAFGVRLRTDAVATVANNTILGARQDGGIRGKGIVVTGAKNATLRENLIASPATSEGTYGIEVGNIGVDRRVVLERNRIQGGTRIGVSVGGIDGEVSLNGDLIAGGSSPMFIGNATGVRVENATVVGTSPIEINSSTLEIDSSILDVPIQSSGGTVDCDIAFSRGPAITEGGNGCAEFQTTASPRFVDPMTFDYHLEADSPLIDRGNPAAPAAGAVDIDGDARALEGDGVCPHGAERDMGYDEVVASVTECPAVPGPDDPTDEGSQERDRVAPETSVAGATKQFGSRARFTLTSTEKGSTFECRLDRGQYAPCESSFRTRKLNLGRHTVFARATDAAGNVDATPFALKFKLKAKR